MEIKLASSTSEIDNCQSILRRVFNDIEGYQLTIPDQYESESHYLYADVDGEMVGALRVVKGTPALGIPLSDVYPIERLQGLGVYGEISRLAILPEYRGKTIGFSTYAVCWELGRKLGLDYFVAEARYEIRALHKRLGFKEFSKPFHDPCLQAEGDAPLKANAVVMIADVKVLCKKLYSSVLHVDAKLRKNGFDLPNLIA